MIRKLLRHKRTREAERAFVIEGVKPIQELLKAEPSSLLAVVATETWLRKSDRRVRQVLQHSLTPVYTCRDSIFEKGS